MTVTSMEILGRDGANLPILPLLRQSRDALARYCEARWPVGRRKAVERAWGLSPDEARGVIEATASAATIDKVWKAGGWAVALPVLSSVIGCSVEDFLQSERRKQLETARKTGALVRDLHALRAANSDPAPGRRAERGGEGGAVHRRRAG
jgi:hypothetical protein